MNLIDNIRKHTNNDTSNNINNTVESENMRILEKKHSDSLKEISSVNNVGNPLLNLSETELRDLSRHQIDTFESWSRRLIDETFKTSYGSDYFNYMISPE